MKMQHLFASAAIAAVVTFTTPLQAQILGGGARGGVGGALGGSFGRGGADLGGTMNGDAQGSLRGHGIGQERVGRTERGTATEARRTQHAGVDAAGEAQQSLHADAANARGDLGRLETRSQRTAESSVTAASAQGSTTGQGAARLGEPPSSANLSGLGGADGSGHVGRDTATAPAPASSTATRTPRGETEPKSTPPARPRGANTATDSSHGGTAPKPAESLGAGADASTSASADASVKPAANE